MASGADKGFFGFKIGYWRLSYRGRFLYDLCMTPIFTAIVAGCMWWWYRPVDITGYWPIGVSVLVMVLVGTASAAYNYSRWKAESRDPGPDASQVATRPK